MRLRPFHAALALALLAALAFRLPAVGAGYPYLNYVDEGHVMNPARRLLATGSWRPAESNYPELTALMIAGAGRLAMLVAPAPARARWQAELARRPWAFQIVEPAELILVGRLLSLLLSLGLVAVSGFYGRRLGGDLAGGAAALAAALVPALVLRGGIVIVDVYAAFFALAALALVNGVERPQQWGRIAAAGACCGLAATAKYPAGLVGLAVVVELASCRWRGRERARAIAIAGVAGAFAAVATMPSLVLAAREVWSRMQWQANTYRRLVHGTYWDQAVHAAEWDLPAQSAELGFTLLALGLAGVAVALASRRWRRAALGWATFAVPLVLVHVRFPFQAFRNLLPLVPLLCLGFGLLAAWAAERLAGRRRWLPASVAAVALLLPVGLFAAPDVRYARERASLVDSRRQAIDWLAHRRTPRGGTLVLREAQVLPRELERLAAPARMLPWEAARPLLLSAQPRYVVVPDLRVPRRELFLGADGRRELDARYVVRRVFGEQEWDLRSVWRGDRLRLYLLERRPGARSRKAATSSATGGNSSLGKFSGLSQNSARPPAPHRS